MSRVTRRRRWSPWRVRPRDRIELRGWLRAAVDLDVPMRSVCGGHETPMDYLDHVFFERGGDVLLWANRGGGKTFYGAVATLLDLIFKPGIEVRILGGSFDQSRKMHAYLARLLDRPGLRELIDGRITRRGVRLRNGSGVELLAQSETSVRGTRVQKLRCDEVELFDRDVWTAAQYVTRSARCGGVAVRGSVEAMSTVHRPFGLMHELIEQASGGAWRLIQWCALDVMGRCTLPIDCRECVLEDSCAASARGGRGFLAVSDVLAQRRRGGRSAFDTEMLCKRPTRTDAVYPMFDAAAHVAPVEPIDGARWVGGMDFGIRGDFVMLWAQAQESAGETQIDVMDEYVRSDGVVGEHLEAMARRAWPRPTWIGADPAGLARNEQTGRSTIAVVRGAGYRVETHRAPINEGIEAVRRYLDPADSTGGPRLRIHPRCRRLIESLSGYHFDPDRRDREAPVKDGHDHAADALRYLIVTLESRRARRVVTARY